MKKQVFIEGMCCARCAKRVANALSVIKNVISVDVNWKKDMAILRSREDITDEQIIIAITNAGYNVKRIENVTVFSLFRHKKN